MRSSVALASAALMLVATLACGKKAEKPAAGGSKNIGQQATDTFLDTRIIGDANARAGEVIRAQSDCDAVRAALPEAETAIQEALEKVHTATGRASLESLRLQVKRIADNCS